MQNMKRFLSSCLCLILGSFLVQPGFALEKSLELIISGTIKMSNNDPIPGVVLSLGTANSTTNSSGYYQLWVNPGDSGTVTPDKQGYNFSPFSITYSPLYMNMPDQDYVGTLSQVKISGVITHNTSPLEGVSVHLSCLKSPACGSSVLTKPDGRYTIYVNPGDNVTITPTMSGYDLAPSFRTDTSFDVCTDTWNFSATPTPPPAQIQFTSPAGGENWPLGSNQEITWTSQGTMENVRIDYTDGSGWSAITPSTSDDGSYSWTVPTSGTPGSNWQIKVSEDGGTVYSISNNFSGVAEPTIVTSPNTLHLYRDKGDGPISDTLHIGNSGTGNLDWSLADDSDWLTCTPDYGTGNATVTVTADPAGFSPGNYQGNIIITDSHATNSPYKYVIEFDIYGRPQLGLTRNRLNFAGIPGAFTPEQSVGIYNSSRYGTLNWSADSNASWMNVTPITGSGDGNLIVSVDPTGLASGSYTGSITIEDGTAGNSPQTFYTAFEWDEANVSPLGEKDPPFGNYDTPLDNSTVESSIPVTGWALDDVGIDNVKIYNGLTYIGDAVFVEGARPDVETAYPDYPMNYRAGWGYMLLTNLFPDGTLTITAIATDIEGKTTTLGTKTITIDNANAVKPFGGIDVPAQGDTASGSAFINWGWALTPQPNTIPPDGSTIKVYLDGVSLGHPCYNKYREDIATLFPGYNNSDGAMALFSIDTTAYENGVHTIFWTATDNGGNTDGIGSRYFTIQNSGGSRSVIQGKNQDQLPGAAPSGTSRAAATYDFNGADRLVVELTQLFQGQPGTPPYTYVAYLKVGTFLRPNPLGSTIIGSTFYWAPGPVFHGSYELVFERTDSTQSVSQVSVDINKPVVAGAPSPIPSLTSWGMALMLVILVITGGIQLRRRKVNP